MNDYDMILMLNKGLYGGTSFVGHQFSRSNIPGTFSYNPQEEEKTDLMFDVSNLYGMIDKLFSISLLFFIYKYFFRLVNVKTDAYRRFQMGRSE